jgi:hypothetical protein
MQKRHLTDEMVRANVDTAVGMIVKWQGTNRTYLSESGVTILRKKDTDWLAVTAWRRSENSETTEKVWRILLGITRD